jgi:hypothetical protein
MATAHIYNTSDDQKAMLDSKKAALEHYIKVSRLSQQAGPFCFPYCVANSCALWLASLLVCNPGCLIHSPRAPFLSVFVAVRGAAEGTHRQAHGIQRSVTVTALPH